VLLCSSKCAQVYLLPLFYLVFELVQVKRYELNLTELFHCAKHSTPLFIVNQLPARTWDADNTH